MSPGTGTQRERKTSESIAVDEWDDICKEITEQKIPPGTRTFQYRGRIVPLSWKPRPLKSVILSFDTLEEAESYIAKKSSAEEISSGVESPPSHSECSDTETLEEHPPVNAIDSPDVDNAMQKIFEDAAHLIEKQKQERRKAKTVVVGTTRNENDMLYQNPSCKEELGDTSQCNPSKEPLLTVQKKTLPGKETFQYEQHEPNEPQKLESVTLMVESDVLFNTEELQNYMVKMHNAENLSGVNRHITMIGPPQTDNAPSSQHCNDEEIQKILKCAEKRRKAKTVVAGTAGNEKALPEKETFQYEYSPNMPQDLEPEPLDEKPIASYDLLKEANDYVIKKLMECNLYHDEGTSTVYEYNKEKDEVECSNTIVEEQFITRSKKIEKKMDKRKTDETKPQNFNNKALNLPNATNPADVKELDDTHKFIEENRIPIGTGTINATSRDFIRKKKEIELSQATMKKYLLEAQAMLKDLISCREAIARNPADVKELDDTHKFIEENKIPKGTGTINATLGDLTREKQKLELSQASMKKLLLEVQAMLKNLISCHEATASVSGGKLGVEFYEVMMKKLYGKTQKMLQEIGEGKLDEREIKDFYAKLNFLPYPTICAGAEEFDDIRKFIAEFKIQEGQKSIWYKDRIVPLQWKPSRQFMTAAHQKYDAPKVGEHEPEIVNTEQESCVTYYDLPDFQPQIKRGESLNSTGVETPFSKLKPRKRPERIRSTILKQKKETASREKSSTGRDEPADRGNASGGLPYSTSVADEKFLTMSMLPGTATQRERKTSESIAVDEWDDIRKEIIEQKIPPGTKTFMYGGRFVPLSWKPRPLKSIILSFDTLEEAKSYNVKKSSAEENLSVESPPSHAECSNTETLEEHPPVNVIPSPNEKDVKKNDVDNMIRYQKMFEDAVRLMKKRKQERRKAKTVVAGTTHSELYQNPLCKEEFGDISQCNPSREPLLSVQKEALPGKETFQYYQHRPNEPQELEPVPLIMGPVASFDSLQKDVHEYDTKTPVESNLWKEMYEGKPDETETENYFDKFNTLPYPINQVDAEEFHNIRTFMAEVKVPEGAECVSYNNNIVCLKWIPKSMPPVHQNHTPVSRRKKRGMKPAEDLRRTVLKRNMEAARMKLCQGKNDTTDR